MIRLLIICIKILYWMIIGWWLEPIKYFRKRKIKKMEEEIIKHEYKKIQKEKKEEI